MQEVMGLDLGSNPFGFQKLKYIMHRVSIFLGLTYRHHAVPHSYQRTDLRTTVHVLKLRLPYHCPYNVFSYRPGDVDIIRPDNIAKPVQNSPKP